MEVIEVMGIIGIGEMLQMKTEMLNSWLRKSLRMNEDRKWLDWLGNE